MTVISARWQLNIRFQTKRVGVERLYNSVEFDEPVASWVKCQLELKIGRSWRRDVVRKATPARRGHRKPWWIGVQRRCWYDAVKKASTQQSGPQGSVWASEERERHKVDGHNFGVKIFQLCSVSSSLSHADLGQPFCTLTNKVGGTYICKEVFLPASLSLRLFIYCVSRYPAWTGIWEYNSFSIATTLRCRGGRYSFPWIAPIYPWYVPSCWVLSKQLLSTIFKVFGMMRPWIEPRSPGPLVNTLPTWESACKEI